MIHASVQVKGLDEALKLLQNRYGAAELQKRGERALIAASNEVLKSAVEAQVPTGTTSPWRRPNSRVRYPGPMAQRIFVKGLPPRSGEIAAAFTGIRTSYTVMVIRGTKPHDIPNYRGSTATWHHPGARSNDIIGRALRRGVRGRLTARVAHHLLRP